jgi:organic radical activating enzyme
MIKQAEIYWHLTDICDTDCNYCPSRLRAGKNKRTTEEYLTVIEKLQESRYQNAESIIWKINGGEPLQFPGLNQLLKKIKSKPCTVRLDTSGGATWFDLIETKDYIDHYKLTHHKWQNISVLNFIVDFCNENNKRLDIVVPLNPGQIFEDREKIKELKNQGLVAYEQILYSDPRNRGDFWDGYSSVDINRILYRPDDWTPPPPEPDNGPIYVDHSQPPKDNSPSYTGQGCYAGVDYIYISHLGYVAGSECGGRDLGNVFDTNWKAPSSAFPCSMNYCRSDIDRKKLRVTVKL